MPCLTPGILITTERGDIAVEDLRLGDKVLTRDNGYQEIRWIGARSLSGRFLLDNPHLRPVRISQDAFGEAMPINEATLSPNARLPVVEEAAGLLKKTGEAMVPVKHMINQSSVQQVDSIGITYILIMFDRHEVIAASGFWFECFHPGDYSMGAMGNAQRNEIFEIFPEVEAKQRRRSTRVAQRRSVRRINLRKMYASHSDTMPELA